MQCKVEVTMQAYDESVRHRLGVAADTSSIEHSVGVFGYDFACVRRVSPVGHQTLFGSTPRPVNNGGVR